MPVYVTHVGGMRMQFGTDVVLTREEQEASFKKIWDDHEQAGAFLVEGYKARPWPGLPPQMTKDELTTWLMDLDGQGW